eukprot:COSAG02_NODE_152_length_33208_cov_13.316591_44_plen_52_part_00
MRSYQMRRCSVPRSECNFFRINVRVTNNPVARVSGCGNLLLPNVDHLCIST